MLPISNSQSILNLFSNSERPYTFCKEEFLIENLIGKGEFSEVHKAEHKKSKEIFALKKILDETQRNVLESEKAILTNLDHPNIIKLIGIVVEKQWDSTTLVLEYAPYRLEDILEHRFLSQDQIGFLMKQILKAVDYLHDYNFIHRDISPKNILINEKGVLKLIDFGLAEKSTATVSLFVLETRTKAGDISDLGNVFVKLHTGDRLFYAVLKNIHKYFNLSNCGSSTKDSYSEMSEFSLQKNYPKLEDIFLGQTVSEEASQLIRQMLCYDPVERISAKDALKHLYIERFGNNYDCERMAQWLKNLPIKHDS